MPYSDAALSQYLGVSERTLKRWKAAEEAPRAYELALYWEGHFGVQHIHADAYNAACQSAALAASLQREVERLRGVIARLEADHDWGSANSPVYLTR